MAEPFYVTTPIYYVNARPHLGHAYTTVIADIVSRYSRMCGRDTFFLTGTDEHGDKIVRAAKAEGVTPLAYVNEISRLFKELWPKLNVAFDDFIRTSDSDHVKVVREVLQKIFDSGDIYFSEYEGAYCFGCERFYVERELVDGRCPDHQTAPEVIKESNYFFKMSRYQDWLIEHISSTPGFITPERYRNEVLAFLREPLEDLCISRPKTRLQWGITLPFDERYVTYVWFDALLNYVSALGYPDGERFKKYWPSVCHIVAKDILKPHGIYWPIILKAAGIPLYNGLHVHGYWNVDETKMSKSLGNVVDPLELRNVYGADAFRYFLAREMVFGLDSSFSEQALIQRVNADLANDLGNLFSRSLTMVHKYFKGVVPPRGAAQESELDREMRLGAQKAIQQYSEAMDDFAFHKALHAVWEYVNLINKYIDITAPWELAKKKSQQGQLQSVLYYVLEGLNVIAGLVLPFMPQAAQVMRSQLGFSSTDPPPELRELGVWGKTMAGRRLPKTVSLFPRIEKEPGARGGAEMLEATEEAVPAKHEIALEVFQQADLRVGTVLHAEPIPRSKKLLKLTVDAAGERTIVAGIADAYRPEELVGRQVVVVVNLKPVKLMGVLSQGMVLVASDHGTFRLLTPDGAVKPGTPIS